jgi:hypothetical protein
MAIEEPNRPPTRLVPARPDLADIQRSGFLPRLPWRYVVGLLLLVAAIVSGYSWRQEQRAAALRVQIRKVHETDLQALRAEYNAALDKLQGLITQAASMPLDEASFDPSLRFEDLRDKHGLYLRLPLDHAGNAQQITEAARQMEPDWIPGCLGLRPTTARELYEIGAFLNPDFIAQLDEENVMKLRVREETLNLRMTQDLPGLRAAMHAPYFALVLQEGESRSEQPVRVFVWDMQQGKLLARARVRAQGILLTGRIFSQGASTERGDEATSAVQANDCSIAGALKRLAAR